MNRLSATASRLTTELWTEDDLAPGAKPSAGFHPHALIKGGDALLMVPMTPGRARAAPLLRWTDSMGLKTIAARYGAWLALRTGLARPWLRTTIGIRTSGNDHGDPALHEYLARALDVPAVVVAGAWGPPRPNQKPVLRIFDHRGATLGFAKVGWNRLTRELVETEANFLATAPALRTMRVPPLIHHGVWRKRVISIAKPLMGRAPIRRSGPPSPDVLAELVNLSVRHTATLGQSSYRQAIPSRFPDGLGGVTGAIAIIDERWANTELAWGQWHGDWTPWNMRHEDDRVIVWDWERTAPSVPVGFDAIHYRFHAALAEGQPPGQALSDAVAAATPTLSRLGVSKDSIPAVGALYALEMQMRFAPYPGEDLPEVAWLPGLLDEAIRRFAGG
ncbi:MAG: hypothetical protein GY788_25445 [bacterium]|nr:hypothetical protein [bacterium]